MKLVITVVLLAFLTACSNKQPEGKRDFPPYGNSPSPQAAASTNPTPSIPKGGDYPARGKVTKINEKNGSIELDHEDIPGVMPPMRMEFNVKDKAMLNGLKVGDAVDFTLEYKHPAETIVAIKKAQ